VHTDGVTTQVDPFTVRVATERTAVRLELGVCAHMSTQVLALSERSTTRAAKERLHTGMNMFMIFQEAPALKRLTAHRTRHRLCQWFAAFSAARSIRTLRHVTIELRAVHEPPVTNRAREGVFRMKTLVQLKRAFHAERFFALVAPILPTGAVLKHVLRQRRRTAAHSTALFADHRPILRVLLVDVLTNVVVGEESFAANLAAARSLAEVRVQLVGVLAVHVSQQTGLLLVTLRTVLTEKRSAGRMQHLVASKVLSRGESERARVAFERPFAGMFSHVF